MSDEKKVFVTEDKAMSGGHVHEVDLKVMDARHGRVIESVEELEALAKAAVRRYELFDVEIGKRMTPERAARIRQLRVDEGYSWRAVAAQCYAEWSDAGWQPPSNQLAGMALCKHAAEHFGEESRLEPWN